MPLTSTNFTPGGLIKAADLMQFYQLFTGVMTDQPVTFANTLTVGGSQGVSSVPLRVSSVSGGTVAILEARTLPADVNPVFAVSRTGVVSLGAGGGTALDLTLTRSGVNQLTISGGTTITTGGLTVGAGAITIAAAASQIIPGATSFSIRDTASANDNLLVSNAGAVTIRAGLTVSASGITVTGNSTITGTLGGLTGLTVASGGITVTGNSTITGTLGGLTGLTVASGGLTITTGGITVQSSIGAALLVNAAGDVFPGSAAAAAGLATTAVAGFLYIESCAGVPTGAPTNYGAGRIPLIYDSANNKIMAYNAGWRGVTVA